MCRVPGSPLALTTLPLRGTPPRKRRGGMRSILIEREGVRFLTEGSEAHLQWEEVKLILTARVKFILTEGSEAEPQ